MCLRRTRFSSNCGLGLLRFKVQPERQAGNLIPVDSQDLKCKREPERIGVEFQSCQVFPLRPFLEHPSPFWHSAWERTRVSMALEGSLWSCVPSSLSCSAELCRAPPRRLAPSWTLLALPGCLASPILFPSALQTSLPFFSPRLGSDAPFL